MAERGIKIDDSEVTTGDSVATRTAHELDEDNSARVIQLMDSASRHATFNTIEEGVTAVHGDNLSTGINLPPFIPVGDKSTGVVSILHTSHEGEVSITPIIKDLTGNLYHLETKITAVGNVIKFQKNKNSMGRIWTQLSDTTGVNEATPKHITYCGENRVMIGRSSGYLFSRDNGASWEDKEFPITSNGGAGLWLGGDIVLAATSAGRVFKSTDGGETFTLKVDLNAQGVTGIYSAGGFAQLPGGVILACFGKGVVCRSSDVGETWTQVGTPSTYTLQGIVYLSHPSLAEPRVYTCDSNSNVYFSTDEGDSWTHQQSWGYGGGSILKTKNGNLIVTNSGGWCISDSGGLTWKGPFGSSSYTNGIPLSDGAILLARGGGEIHISTTNGGSFEVIYNHPSYNNAPVVGECADGLVLALLDSYQQEGIIMASMESLYQSPTLAWDLMGAHEVAYHITAISAGNEVTVKGGLI